MGILVKFRKNRDLGKRYDRGLQLRSWLHRLIRFNSWEQTQQCKFP